MSTTETLDQTSIPIFVTSNGPVHKKFTSTSSRITSFGKWNYKQIQWSVGLAFTGFFNSGLKDRVICFYCGLGLYKWEKIDNP
jgi:hypothetical protein